MKTSHLHRTFQERKIAAQTAVVDHAGDPTEVPVVTNATEDLDPMRVGPRPVVMIEPQPETAQEVARTYQELEADEEGQAREEFTDTVEALESIRDMIVAGNEAGGLSAVSAYFSAMAIESYTTRLGVHTPELTTAFESAISETGRVQVSVESLNTTLESVNYTGKFLVKRLAASVIRLLIPTWINLKVQAAVVTTLVGKASAMKALPGAKIKVRTTAILEGESASTNVSASLVKAAEILKYMVKGFGEDATRDFKSNLEALEMLDKPTAEETMAEVPKLLARWKDPRSKLGQKASLPLIGNYRLFEDHELQYKGDNAAFKGFDALAHLNYPTLVGFQGYASDAGVDSRYMEIPALTPAEITKIGLALKVAIANFGKWRAIVEKLSAATTLFVAGTFPARLMLGPFTLVTWSAFLAAVIFKRKRMTDKLPSGLTDLDTIYEALETSNRLRFHVGYDAGRVLNRIVFLYIKLAKLSMKAHAIAALESMAVDGVSVNETSPIEPVQAPGKDDQAPEGEVMAHKPTVQDNPEAKQDLNGPVSDKRTYGEQTFSLESLIASKTPVPYWMVPHLVPTDSGTGDG